MSEKIYLWLWRLYPPHFREAYHDAALQLFRDRARHEKGFVRQLRLWLDLLTDLASSVPRVYFDVEPALSSIPAGQVSDGAPSFYVLGDEPSRLRALLYGAAVSFVIFGSISVAIGHGGTRTVLGSWPRRQPPTDVYYCARAVEEGVRCVRAIDEGFRLDAAQRHRLIEEVGANLRQYYFDRTVSQKMADALLAHERSGDDAATKGQDFADRLTRQMQSVSHDLNLSMDYSREPLSEHPPDDTPESLARYRKAMEQEHCMFRKVEILPNGIGYLRLNFFPDTSVCGSMATGVMASLNRADAIIFDLRDNTGGFENMVTLIAGYLFDHPEYMYSPRSAPTEQSWTRSPVPGNRLADKPVYVLTSASTWSGAEQFSYDLKMLRRAILVGETTRGGAHAGVFHRIDDHFGVGIPEVKPINPFGAADWEGTGVEPDVKVKAADALETAKKLVESRLLKK